MEKYYEIQILMFDENNVPETKEMLCVKTDAKPSVEDIELNFEDIINKENGDEVGAIVEISEEDALEDFGNAIIEL